MAFYFPPSHDPSDPMTEGYAAASLLIPRKIKGFGKHFDGDQMCAHADRILSECGPCQRMMEEVAFYLEYKSRTDSPSLRAAYQKDAWKKICRYAANLRMDARRRAARAAAPQPALTDPLTALRAIVPPLAPPPPKPRGRPPTARGPMKLRSVLMTDDEHARYRELAREAGVSFGEWVRRACERTAFAETAGSVANSG